MTVSAILQSLASLTRSKSVLLRNAKWFPNLKHRVIILGGSGVSFLCLASLSFPMKTVEANWRFDIFLLAMFHKMNRTEFFIIFDHANLCVFVTKGDNITRFLCLIYIVMEVLVQKTHPNGIFHLLGQGDLCYNRHWQILFGPRGPNLNSGCKRLKLNHQKQYLLMSAC